MADEVVLLDFWVSPFGQRCRIALAEKGVEYEYSEQSLADKSDLFLRSNPVHKKVPVLLHGGRPVCESLAILEYIDEAWPEKAPPLLPAAADDPYGRARARFWADYVDKRLFDCQTRLWKLRAGEDGHEQAKRDMVDALRALEAELGDRVYFGGEAFGYLDVVLVPFAAWFHAYERLGGFAVAEHCPRLVAWAERCKERDSVAATLSDPGKVYEFALYLKDKFGAK
ncbi:probable glutathione S-transferase GSTU1 [Oryza brachyantha]|uniref:Glutathione S-transferase n=1 Tax=Oryza brachyantha TaxID=4533 RepID=J3MWY7_ORYBR|nr:probable glutathione S-transferase GSTU1 [Oryza brachyantha]